jgi:hypothetical protein
MGSLPLAVADPAAGANFHWWPPAAFLRFQDGKARTSSLPRVEGLTTPPTSLWAPFVPSLVGRHAEASSKRTSGVLRDEVPGND